MAAGAVVEDVLIWERLYARAATRAGSSMGWRDHRLRPSESWWLSPGRTCPPAPIPLATRRGIDP